MRPPEVGKHILDGAGVTNLRPPGADVEMQTGSFVKELRRHGDGAEASASDPIYR